MLRDPGRAHLKLNELKKRAEAITSDSDPEWDQIDMHLQDFAAFFDRLSKPIPQQYKGAPSTPVYDPSAQNAGRAFRAITAARQGVAARSVKRTTEAIGRAALEIRGGGISDESDLETEDGSE